MHRQIGHVNVNKYAGLAAIHSASARRRVFRCRARAKWRLRELQMSCVLRVCLLHPPSADRGVVCLSRDKARSYAPRTTLHAPAPPCPSGDLHFKASTIYSLPLIGGRQRPKIHQCGISRNRLTAEKLACRVPSCECCGRAPQTGSDLTDVG